MIRVGDMAILPPDSRRYVVMAVIPATGFQEQRAFGWEARVVLAHQNARGTLVQFSADVPDVQVVDQPVLQLDERAFWNGRRGTLVSWKSVEREIVNVLFPHPMERLPVKTADFIIQNRREPWH